MTTAAYLRGVLTNNIDRARDIIWDLTNKPEFNESDPNVLGVVAVAEQVLTSLTALLVDCDEAPAQEPVAGEQLYRRKITRDRIWYEPVAATASQPVSLARQWIIDLIHNEYDPHPSHYTMSDLWDDGTGRIADAILALTPSHEAGTPKTITLKFTDQELAVVQELSEFHQLSELQTMRQALRLYQLQDKRIRDGETATWSGDAQRAKDFAGPLASEAPAPLTFRKAVARLVNAARTSGGTAGHDKTLCQACEEVEAFYATPEAGTQRNPAFVKSILAADAKPPEATFSNAKDALAYLNDEAGTQEPVAETRANNIVDRHVAMFGYVPNPDELKIAIRTYLALTQIEADNRAAPASHDATREQTIEECAKLVEEIPSSASLYENGLIAIRVTNFKNHAVKTIRALTLTPTLRGERVQAGAVSADDGAKA